MIRAFCHFWSLTFWQGLLAQRDEENNIQIQTFQKHASGELQMETLGRWLLCRLHVSFHRHLPKTVICRSSYLCNREQTEGFLKWLNYHKDRFWKAAGRERERGRFAAGNHRKWTPLVVVQSCLFLGYNKSIGRNSDILLDYRLLLLLFIKGKVRGWWVLANL